MIHQVVPTVAALIFDKEGRVLIGIRRGNPEKPYLGKWDLPAGKLEPGETDREALGREVREETGLEVTGAVLFDVHNHCGPGIEGLPGRNVCYRVTASGVLAPNGDLRDLQWVAPQNAVRMDLTPWSRQFLEKVAAETLVNVCPTGECGTFPMSWTFCPRHGLKLEVVVRGEPNGEARYRFPYNQEGRVTCFCGFVFGLAQRPLWCPGCGHEVFFVPFTTGPEDEPCLLQTPGQKKADATVSRE